jgi:hypothetical protein
MIKKLSALVILSVTLAFAGNFTILASATPGTGGRSPFSLSKLYGNNTVKFEASLH